MTETGSDSPALQMAEMLAAGFNLGAVAPPSSAWRAMADKTAWLTSDGIRRVMEERWRSPAHLSKRNAEITIAYLLEKRPAPEIARTHRVTVARVGQIVSRAGLIIWNPRNRSFFQDAETEAPPL